MSFQGGCGRSGGVSEGVVEGIERAIRRDGNVELISERASSTETLSVFSRGCQSSRT